MNEHKTVICAEHWAAIVLLSVAPLLQLNAPEQFWFSMALLGVGINKNNYICWFFLISIPVIAAFRCISVSI